MVAPKGKVKDRDRLVDRKIGNPVTNNVRDFKVFRGNTCGHSKPSDLGNGRKSGNPRVYSENPVLKKADRGKGNVVDKKNGTAGVPTDRIERKPLADVSNTRITSSRRPLGFCKPMQDKTVSATLEGPARKSSIGTKLPTRKSSIPTCLPVRKTSIASSTLARKSSKSENETNISQENLASSKGAAKFRTNFSNEKITDGRTASIRVKQPNQTLNSLKTTSRNPEKSVGKASSTVHVGRKVLVGLPRGIKNSTTRNHLVDDTKLMHLLPAKNLKIDGKASSRMLTTGTVTDQYSKPGVTVKSKGTICNEKKAIANDFMDVSSVKNKQKEAGETRSDNAGGNVSTNGFKPNKGRRKSYTSMLVEGPKGDLLSIDDSRNHLEVAEYVNEIYQYYWNMEAYYPLPANYMTIQTEVTTSMRDTLINWLIEVHLKFELMEETMFLMVQLVDRFLSEFAIRKDEMQLLGITALLLASKYEDYWHPKISDLISISFDLYTRDEVLAMEKLMLKKLKFRLNLPTPYVFMLRFLKAGQSDKKLKHLAFYLIELCLVQSEALKFKASLLCASAIYVARCNLQLTPRWTGLLVQHTHYEESHLKACAGMILGFQRIARKDQLRVIYEKYLVPERDGVAKIKPIAALPI
ncbi:hypothetical protein H6P81_013718 [Aristolochia fimbriata]|uniref:Cyclin N-terminal domain-containing protein n=1 Tax=Aristolochia fimbriata TaxID=158543 RepID=A0AAV7EFH3_ARIFI|nr:hypothetical protein H6P81_013718 [Aristolochia fimbriata]